MEKTIIRVISGVLLLISFILFIIFWNKVYNGSSVSINLVTGKTYMLALWAGILLFASQLVRLFEIREDH